MPDEKRPEHLVELGAHIAASQLQWTQMNNTGLSWGEMHEKVRANIAWQGWIDPHDVKEDFWCDMMYLLIQMPPDGLTGMVAGFDVVNTFAPDEITILKQEPGDPERSVWLCLWWD